MVPWMMRGLFWLLGFMLVVRKSNTVDIDEYEKNLNLSPENPPTNPPSKSPVWGKIMAFCASGVVSFGFTVGRLLMRKKTIDVPGTINLSEETPEQMVDVSNSGFDHVEKEFDKAHLKKNFKAKNGAHYKLVSFPCQAGIIPILAIGLFKWWGIGNFSEIQAIDKQCNLRELGLGESFMILTLGTIFKTTSVTGICCPLLHYYKNPATDAKVKKLYLKDILFDDVPPNCYILFRTK